jgi:hypothetical protein
MWSLLDVRFGAHSGLKSDMARCPRWANKRLMHRRNRISIRSPCLHHGDQFIDATDDLIGDERDFIDDKISSSVLRLEPARLRSHGETWR